MAYLLLSSNTAEVPSAHTGGQHRVQHFNMGQSKMMHASPLTCTQVAIINGIAAYFRDKQTQAELYASERRFEQ